MNCSFVFDFQECIYVSPCHSDACRVSPRHPNVQQYASRRTDFSRKGQTGFTVLFVLTTDVFSKQTSRGAWYQTANANAGQQKSCSTLNWNVPHTSNKKFCEELRVYFPLIRHGPHRKRRVSIVYVFAATVTYLPSRCLATYIYRHKDWWEAFMYAAHMG
jgi:hypothetical protein